VNPRFRREDTTESPATTTPGGEDHDDHDEATTTTTAPEDHGEVQDDTKPSSAGFAFASIVMTGTTVLCTLLF
jgi:hypothetical protein